MLPILLFSYHLFYEEHLMYFDLLYKHILERDATMRLSIIFLNGLDKRIDRPYRRRAI